MKVNPKVFTERLDAFGNVKIPNCNPAELKAVAEKILDMAISLDYNIGRYRSTGELARKITIDYWDKYNDLSQELSGDLSSFRTWYLHTTKSATIERACRWLIHEGYLICPVDIIQEMYEKEENYTNAVKRK
jgi:hypothetical protein